MLKIHFTGDDIARTRIAPGPDPLWELVLSLQMLRPQRGDLLFAGWRQEAREAVRGASRGEILSLLLALTPNVGYFPDFLNPIEAVRGLEHGLEAIRSTPISVLRRNVSLLAARHSLPRSTRRLTDGEPALLAELTETLRTCYDMTVTPYRQSIDTAVARDRRIRTTALAHGGVEGLLASLRPTMIWSDGGLSVPGHRHQELHLHGRGLLLIPSYFCVSGPLTLFDPELPPVLVYPVERGPDTLPTRASTALTALTALIGHTRATVLNALGTRDGTTTTGLARQLGVSVASASEHTTVLRQAGLVSSRRDRNRMLHQLTDLGLALLETNR
ncbi:ArsR family transcriptional regulator [Nonomuraea sp. LPB2021202275-12-8]|uniref:ArsR family transcriptional regulator n=1 Tax=Nonomuraea sp. LPB2021202275-12-8 TaxID=3120159 RepID=UPI00300CC42B